ncbi:MAG: exodeoxyribonuclease VII small subunit [Candidatus Cloacimonadales bacterium]
MKVEPKNYETAVKQLQTVIDKIEESEISLEQMMELYEQGKELIVYCEKQLNKFEEKIQVINLKNQEKE